jgi:hypothetical protein
MRKLTLNIIVIIAVLLLAQASFALSFDPTLGALGARPIGLGRAFVGLADDTNSLFINPAGLGLMDKWSVTSMYTKLLDTVDYRLLGGTYKTEYGTIGLGYIGTSNPSGYHTGASTDEVFEKISFDTHTLIISYGSRVGELLEMEDLPEDTLIGASLKFLSQGFTGGDQEDKSGSGFNIDLGVMAQLEPWARAGVTLNNVIPEAMSWSSGANEDMPMRLNVSGAFNLMGPAETSIYENDRPLIGVLDASFGSTEEEGFSLHGGLEWRPTKHLNIRCGLDQANTSDGEGSTGSVTNLTAGVGLRYGGVTFDYAYHQDGNLEANQSHYFSISFSPQDTKERSAKKTSIYSLENVEGMSESTKAEDPGYHFEESGNLKIRDDDSRSYFEDFDFGLEEEDEVDLLIVEEDGK